MCGEDDKDVKKGTQKDLHLGKKQASLMSPKGNNPAAASKKKTTKVD